VPGHDQLTHSRQLQQQCVVPERKPALIKNATAVEQPGTAAQENTEKKPFVSYMACSS